MNMDDELVTHILIPKDPLQHMRLKGNWGIRIYSEEEFQKYEAIEEAQKCRDIEERLDERKLS